MPDTDQIASQLLELIGFEVGSKQHRLLLEAVEYFMAPSDTKFTDDVLDMSDQAAIIMAFSFGLRPNDNPGATNVALAAIIEKILGERKGLPVFAQWEVADALRARGRVEDFRAVRRGRYLSTQGVVDQFCEELERLDWNVETAVLVAHPDHIFRCRRLVEKRGFEVMIPRQYAQHRWTEFGCDMWGYDPASVQDWTTNRAGFILHELDVLARTL